MGCILLSTIKDWDTGKECFLGGDMCTDNECYKLKMQYEGQYLGSKKKTVKNRHIREVEQLQFIDTVAKDDRLQNAVLIRMDWHNGFTP